MPAPEISLAGALDEARAKVARYLDEMLPALDNLCEAAGRAATTETRVDADRIVFVAFAELEQRRAAAGRALDELRDLVRSMCEAKP